MFQPNQDPLLLFLALLPILLVLLLMLLLKWGAAKAGAAGWLIACFVSVIGFGTSPTVIAVSQMRGLLLSVYVLYVIWPALILYNVIREAGAINRIGKGISNLTNDGILQGLILGWVFSSFLQGIAGYGVPIAVVAPLLVSIGFTSTTAVIAVSVGHAWSVTFGSMAASFTALVASSGIAPELLAPTSALLLGIVCLLCGIALTYIFGKFRGLLHGLPAVLILGVSMALTQYFVATLGMWNIAAFTSGLVGLGVSILVSRLTIYRNSKWSNIVADLPSSGKKSISISMSVISYAILVIVVGISELVPSIHAWLNSIKLQVIYPQTETALGWVIQSGKGQTISIFGHAGALLIYSSIIIYIIYLSTGYLKKSSIRSILSNTNKSGLTSSIGIITMVGMALLMDQSGMTYTIAFWLSQGIAKAFPFLSPFIGLLGAFMTGSNTNSNILFSTLQQGTAELLNLPVILILALQTTGGSIGGMLAPARIIVGCSTVGLAGKEGGVLKSTLVYGVLITIIIGIIGLFLVELT